MTRTSAFLGGAFLLAAISVVLADQSPRLVESPSTTLRVETRVVQVDVVATDSHNKPIANLSKSDFVLTDNGKVRAIDIFSVNGGEAESAAPAGPVVRPSVSSGAKVFTNRNPGPPAVPPHSSVIVLDQVNAFFDDAANGQKGVLELMRKLPADEQIAVYVIVRDDGLLLLQNYTSDHDLVIRSLTKYRPRRTLGRPDKWPISIQDEPGPVGITVFPPDASRPPLPPLRPLDKEYFDAIWRKNAEQARLAMKALSEHLAHLPGRKSLYWVTQAFPARFMEIGWDKTLQELNEANVAVNTVDSRGLFLGSRIGSTTMNTMSQISEATGGKAYHNRNDLDGAMAEGIAASRVSYTLGFYLPESERDQAFHTLKITTARAGTQLYYRQGYYAGNTDLPSEKSAKGDLESVLLNQVDSTGVGLTAGVKPVGDSLQIQLNLDPGTLSLRENKGVPMGHVEEEVLEQDASGKMLAKITDTRDFEIPGSATASYQAHGVSWPLSIPLKPGATKVTIVVRDSVTGKIGSLTIPLQ